MKNVYDYVMIKCAANGNIRENLILFIKENGFEYAEDERYNGWTRIIIFEMPVSTDYRSFVFSNFGWQPWFSFEGFMRREESSLYKIMMEIKGSK